MKKVKVDKDKCIGCGACISIDGEHFDFDSEKGVSVVISQKNVVENETINEAISEAVDACPVGAIEVFDGCDNEKCLCNPCTCEGECNCDGETCNCDNCEKNES